MRLVTQKGDTGLVARQLYPYLYRLAVTVQGHFGALGLLVHPKCHLLSQLLLGSRLRCIGSHAAAIGHGVRGMIQRLPARTEQRARLLGHRRLKFTHASVRRQPLWQQLLCRRSPRWITQRSRNVVYRLDLLVHLQRCRLQTLLNLTELCRSLHAQGTGHRGSRSGRNTRRCGQPRNSRDATQTCCLCHAPCPGLRSC